MDVDAHAIAGALDLDASDTGAIQAGLQEVADLDVLGDIVAVPLSCLGAVGEPARHVVGGDAETEPVGVYLLSHYFFPFDPLVELVETFDPLVEPVEAFDPLAEAFGPLADPVETSSGVASTTVM